MDEPASKLWGTMRTDGPGMLAGVRIIEIADETAEYVGLLCAGLGAEVIKVEPPDGSPSRQIGPFFGDDQNRERSLFFWHYNRNKKSVTLDLDAVDGRKRLLNLLSDADVLIDSSNGGLNEQLGLERAELAGKFPSLVIARMTPFGDSGLWARFKGSDLIHLALGGVMMNCGYDPNPKGEYDLPPIAPQLWHAFHIAGDQLAVGIVAALVRRQQTGQGQDVTCAIHEAISKNTELDVMSWIMRRAPLFRQTCRHATEKAGAVPTISHTKDGRWFISSGVSEKDRATLVTFLERYGAQADLLPPSADADAGGRFVPGSMSGNEAVSHVYEVIQRFVRAWRYDKMPWREAQEAGLLWAPLRKPHESALDQHWLSRGAFADVWHPEHNRSFRYATSKWLSTETTWQVGKRAPLLGEDNEAIFAARARQRVPAMAIMPSASKLSPHGKPFPLQNIRILDFSWFLASAGGTRYLAALGAESLKVEWKSNPDTRLAAMAPVGGRAAREKATAPLPGVKDADMGGQFNNKNSGKRGLSLNIRDPRGLAIAKELVKMSDIVAEGFSPGVLQRLGLGYDVLKKLKPDIIYIQQAGMGAHGEYGRLRTIGPVAAAFAGTSEMSGLPEPAMPAGWGYSFLDWMGAYSYALALLGALHHRNRTGEGQWIDASQCESGLFLAGPAVLDWSANGRVWNRIGNRSPYKPAAPHGAFRCAGDDRWIAVACFTDDEWRALAQSAGHVEWLGDPRFVTLAMRLAHQDALEAAVTAWTVTQSDYDCMMRLQAAGVPAGVCQNAQDRCENDPQLKTLNWLTEVTGTKIGRWPVGEIPIKLDATPAFSGGIIDRGAPCYGEDNESILTEYLGMSKADVKRLADDGVI